jgi:hypothetical protein
MTFTYKVEADINRFKQNKEETFNNESMESEFTDSDPFIAREAAFRKAKSYEDIFNQANSLNIDGFFKLKDGFYSEYNISVYFINPDTKEEIEIHNTKSIHDNQTVLNGEETYDPIQTKWILEALNSEFDILKQNNISTSKAKSIDVTFQPSNEKITYFIFPTEMINTDKLIVTDLEL